MLASLNGKIVEKDSDHIVLEVGGVGFQVFVTAPTLAEVKSGQTVALFTHLVVREDALTLFGFESKEEREFFTILLSVNGVGPRLALGVLSVMNPNTIRRAVFGEQVELFSRVPGVGKKTAQKILLHLQDRVKTAEGFEPLAEMPDRDTEVMEALTTLGYSVIEAQAAVQSIPKDAPDDTEERLLLALQYFHKPG